MGERAVVTPSFLLCDPPRATKCLTSVGLAQVLGAADSRVGAKASLATHCCQRALGELTP